MLCFKFFLSNLIFVFSLTLITCPTNIMSLNTQSSSENCINLPFTYDDIIDLLDHIENEDIGDCSAEEFEEIVHFLIFLSRQGVLSTDESEELEKDIQELLGDDADSDVPDYTFENIGIIIQKIIKGHR